MTNKTPLISTTLCVGGDEFDADELTRILGIQPTEVWRQPRIEALKAYPDLSKFAWNYKIARQQSWSLDDAVTRLTEIFNPVREQLMTFVNAHKLKVTIGCYVRSYGQRPLFELSANTVKHLADFNAELSIDIEGLQNEGNA
jgi:hypothetical protein